MDGVVTYNMVVIIYDYQGDPYVIPVINELWIIWTSQDRIPQYSCPRFSKKEAKQKKGKMFDSFNRSFSRVASNHPTVTTCNVQASDFHIGASPIQQGDAE